MPGVSTDEERFLTKSTKVYKGMTTVETSYITKPGPGPFTPSKLKQLKQRRALAKKAIALSQVQAACETQDNFAAELVTLKIFLAANPKKNIFNYKSPELILKLYKHYMNDPKEGWFLFKRICDAIPYALNPASFMSDGVCKKIAKLFPVPSMMHMASS
jgi:hypothetical protein